MKLRITLIALFVFLASLAQAGPGGCTNSPSLFPFADEVITVSSTAVGLTATKYAPEGARPADMAVCTVETDSVRYRVTGVAPTASVGQILIATASAPKDFTICGPQNVKAIKFIRVTTDASITCAYYRETN